MYYVKKRMEIAGAHMLKLSYDSKCTQLHGHNWIVEVYCVSDVLTVDGMVADFTHIKKQIADQLDHKYINDIIGDINPTAENIAKWICDQIKTCYKVTVQESEGNVAMYVKEGFHEGL